MIQNKNLALTTIFVAGLIAGTTDILAAIVNYLVSGGTKPSSVFKFIASGVFGKEAFQPGAAMIWMGVLFHYLIALTWTAIFYLIYRQVEVVRRNIILSGILYGTIVWILMNRVILPLSNVPMGAFDWKKAAIGMLILMLFFGLPIALVVRAFYKSNRRAAVV